MLHEIVGHRLKPTLQFYYLFTTTEPLGIDRFEGDIGDDFNGLYLDNERLGRQYIADHNLEGVLRDVAKGRLLKYLESLDK